MSFDGLSAGGCVVLGASAVELGAWSVVGGGGAGSVAEVERRSRPPAASAGRAFSPGTVSSGRAGTVLGRRSSSPPQAVA